jgi:diaminohydroxyphosphoribosylaminopyrimidine deaminase/5-amino-6-(5-phosphoribosylamino)uracil reductase
MTAPALEPEQVWAWLLELSRQARTAPAGRENSAALNVIDDNGAWIAKSSLSDASAELLDLYLPIALAGRERPLTVAHLGQSLDGRIATENGSSCYVTGSENLTHLHRMRALCDAIVVGAGTVEHDDPQLTTRRVIGPNPVRVILDPRRRLNIVHGVFQDRAAPTLLVCAKELADSSAPEGAEIIGVSVKDEGLDLADLLLQLHQRSLFGIFIEGGGLTVSAFLQQGLLDRLQLTIAPLIMGSGRPGICLPPIQHLSQGLRPRHRRYVMGDDVLFDCRLRD